MMLGEDFALQRVPRGERRSLVSVGQVALGIPTALVFLATGGSLWMAYGAGALAVGLCVAIALIGSAGYVLTSFACRSGLDSDLMSIWAGYGLRGSALASLIYSANFIILFAIEDSIVADAIHAHYATVPRSAIFIVIGALVLALSWYGISRLSRVMAVTLPLLIILFVWIVIEALHSTPDSAFWSAHIGASQDGSPAFLSVLAALLAFTVNATVGADIGRFLQPRDRRRGALLVGVGLQLVCFGVVMMFGAWLTYRLRGNVNPGDYLVGLAGIGGLVLVVLSQTRINCINAYAGSLSLSNFGKRGAGLQPGRHVWMIAVVVVATILALGGIYKDLLNVLTFEATFITAWVGTLVAYVLCASPDRLRAAADIPVEELGRGYPSVVALTLALICAVPLAFGAAGALGKAIAPLLALAVASGAVWGAVRLRMLNTALSSQ